MKQSEKSITLPCTWAAGVGIETRRTCPRYADTHECHSLCLCFSLEDRGRTAPLTWRLLLECVTVISVIQTFRPQMESKPSGTWFTDRCDTSHPEAQQFPPSLLNSELLGLHFSVTLWPLYCRLAIYWDSLCHKTHPGNTFNTASPWLTAFLNVMFCLTFCHILSPAHEETFYISCFL